MALTEVNTEKVPGRISHVIIGYDATHGIDIISGIKSFTYGRVHDAKRADTADSKTSAEIFQPHSKYTWRLEFLSDCRAAFVATDVQVAGGNQYALDPNGDSNKIEYFHVHMEIEKEDGTTGTRNYDIGAGYCLRNGADIGDDQDAVYWYEGDAEQITYNL